MMLIRPRSGLETITVKKTSVVFQPGISIKSTARVWGRAGSNTDQSSRSKTDRGVPLRRSVKIRPASCALTDRTWSVFDRRGRRRPTRRRRFRPITIFDKNKCSYIEKSIHARIIHETTHIKKGLSQGPISGEWRERGMRVERVGVLTE